MTSPVELQKEQAIFQVTPRSSSGVSGSSSPKSEATSTSFAKPGSRNPTPSLPVAKAVFQPAQLTPEAKNAVCEMAAQAVAYQFQYLLQFGNTKQRTKLLGKIVGHVLELSYDKYASGCVIRALQTAHHFDKVTIAMTLLDQRPQCLRKLATHEYGSNVLMECFRIEDAILKTHLVKCLSFCGNVIHLARDKYACRVIEQVLLINPHHYPACAPLIWPLLQKLCLPASMEKLCEDQYSCLVLQAFMRRDPIALANVETFLRNRYVHVCCLEHGSKVVNFYLGFVPQAASRLLGSLVHSAPDELVLLAKTNHAKAILVRMLSMMNRYQRRMVADKYEVVRPKLVGTSGATIYDTLQAHGNT